jgi:hypothetical protein
MKRKTIAFACFFGTLAILAIAVVLINIENKVLNLQNQIVGLEEQAEDIQKKINFLLNPKIVTNLGVTDVRREPYRLYIDGHAGNYGFETAYDCSLEVVLFRGSKVVEETSIWWGTVEGGEYVKVIENIHYFGDKLTHWTITPVFD